MRGTGRGLLLLALLVAPVARAEAPLESVRPEARPSREAPGRPEVRPSEEAMPADGEPDPLEEPPELEPPPRRSPLPEPTRDRLPAVPRDPPLLSVEPLEPPLEGPAGIVRAELLFQGPPPVLVVVDGWEGDAPPARPGAEPRRVEAPAQGRPRLRPLSPADPEPILPPEPDAPPVYAPGDRPDILPVGPQYSPYAVARTIPPQARPEGIVERAEQARLAAVRGQVCGIPALQGEVVAPVRDGGGCGIEEPVRVRTVDGVRLSEASLMDCATAEALLEWVQDAARPAVGSRGGGLVGIEVMGHYSCRPRNNQAGARMSEHGRGRAIDIGGVVLADGSAIRVARDWPDPALREMHGEACGIFNTTLGPGSDGFHEDHLHFDTARGRGPYCR